MHVVNRTANLVTVSDAIGKHEKIRNAIAQQLTGSLAPGHWYEARGWC